MRSLCARIPVAQGEFLHKKLTDAKLIDKNLMIKHNDRFLFIPLCSHPNDSWLKVFHDMDVELLEEEFEKYPIRINDYRANVKLPIELFQHLPRSYDIIGNIAILKIPEPLNDFSKQIGDAIIKTYKNIKTVAIDFGVKGDRRVRKLKVIAGVPNTETIHKEYGIKLSLDVSKVYFSPRLSEEHYRISQLVQPGELVLDMFAGVGPFSIMIAKYSKAQKIYSSDINKFAIKYLIKNIDINKVTNILPFEGDAKEIIRKIPKVDRIIMNLPFGAHEYLSDSLMAIKPKGTIHYHEMVSEAELSTRTDQLKSIAQNNSFSLISIKEHNLGSYSPSIYHYCFDLELRK